MNWLEKIKNKKSFDKGSWEAEQKLKLEASLKKEKTELEKDFTTRHGGEALKNSGESYASTYEYNPSLKDKFLDKLPILGGYRGYNRARDYASRVHGDPKEELKFSRHMQTSVDHWSQFMDKMSAGNGEVKDQSQRSIVQKATGDPRYFTNSFRSFQSGNSSSIKNDFMYGSSLGHRAINNSGNYRAIDKHNIATTREGKKGPFGIYWGRTGKVTSNVKADGGYKINPMVDTNPIQKQYQNQDEYEVLDLMDYSGNAE